MAATARKKKRKGHQGFSFKCRKIMSYREWERRVKAVKRKNKNKNVNPYAIVNASCKSHRRRRLAR